MQRYIGPAQIVSAEPMDLVTARKKYLVDSMDSSDGANEPGYAVVDKDGDHSWWPKAVFERYYRPITN